MCPLVKKSSIKSTTILFSSYLFILLFLYAAVSKLLSFETFKVQLAQSPLLSAYADIIAWLVPGIEILIAFLLVIARFRTLALYASFTLMIMFTAYIFIILNFSDFIPCSCGGVLEKLSWTQHLIFNAFFILLAGVAVFFTVRKNAKKTLLMLTTLAIFGIGTVTLLFAFSEKKMHRNNAFQRRYVPHPIKMKGAIDLSYNSFYIAGITDSLIYLGNVTAPLNVLELSKTLKIENKYRVQLDKMDLPYSNIKIEIQPPYFYVSDGTVPVILKGNTTTWQAKTIMQNQFYFSQVITLDTTQTILRTIDGTSKKNVIASFSPLTDSLNIKNELLQTEEKSLFATDGQLLYDSILGKIIYVYYYRNQFVVFDKDLNLDYVGNTIDTISKAQLNIIHNTSTNENKLKGDAVIVNQQAAIAGNYLFIVSNRLGKYEETKVLQQATIVDVYNITKNRYEFSFYIYNYKGQQVSRFEVNKNRLIALMGDYLVIYQLNETYFKE